MLDITEFYIKTFNDQYFINEPVWFHFFMLSELLIQVPVMVWGVGALLRGMSSFPFASPTETFDLNVWTLKIGSCRLIR